MRVCATVVRRNVEPMKTYNNRTLAFGIRKRD